ncbi:cbb3-type cytochrome oxidase subunit 3 [Alkalihalobacillus xiaoxiensis]|uniref:Cbb3-type cytochrome oxidase subunit 3 n=1 Tax=Shouchella xiaoxiensis TaxID=766895 RepID=A0ABS2ST01_9BACI|nr:cbb3-type cytochrome oxidase subunit 3 [Shouchella xiaoxiensis]
MRRSNRFWLVIILSIVVIYGILYWALSEDVQWPY